MTAGTCFGGTEVFGSAPAKDASDCCYLCNAANGPNVAPETSQCTDFTFNATDKLCHLFHLPTLSTLDPICVSGHSPGHKDLACRDGNALDCNNQGSCTGGKCVCKGGYTGKACEFVPAEKCMIEAGKCITGTQIGGFGADDVGNCCHGCTHFPGCTNFTFNASTTICTLHSDAATSVLGADCTSGQVTKNLPPPPPPPPAKTYKCEPASGKCVEDPAGTYTTADCDSKCTAPPAPPTPPPPAKKYKCDTSSPSKCVEDDDAGTYTTADCDSKCGTTGGELLAVDQAK
eukprot:SAG22_NODE_541_length_9297_cov_9.387149_2_plen_288_part_00